MTGGVSRKNLALGCCSAYVGFVSCIGKAAAVHLLFAYLCALKALHTCVHAMACILHVPDLKLISLHKQRNSHTS